MKNKFDISIIGGLGHVGLPLGIVFANEGLKVNLIDINKKSAALVKKAIMPFTEYGSEKILKKVIINKKLSVSFSLSDISKSKIIIITVGTPLDHYNKPNIDEIMRPIKDFKKYLNNDQLLIIRSSVFPGTCESIFNYLSKDKKINLAYCPERIKQGYAIEEIYKLPQIISAFDNMSYQSAKKLFLLISPKVIKTSIAEAELIKLFTNSYRYIQFAMANQFYMMSEKKSLNYERLRSIMSDSYERVNDLPSAGLSAGPCLMKDTMQLSAFFDDNFLLGYSSKVINEGLPDFIINKIEKKYKIKNLVIGLLGMAFKANIDDTRDSLAFRFKKILKYKDMNLLCSDYLVKNQENLVNHNVLVKKSDIIIICAPHNKYKNLNFRGKKVFDIWNILSKNQNFKRI